MNGKKAKLLRKIVYGEKHHKKSRKYGAKKLDDVIIKVPDDNEDSGFRLIEQERFMIVSNVERQQYQKLKRMVRGIEIPMAKRISK